MGQIKGNPSADRSLQNQAYTNLYGVGNAANRDGSKPVMIDSNTTLNEVVDATFGTDVDDSNIWNHLGTITGSNWTPTISNKAGVFAGTVNRVNGYYQKIGNIVSFTMHAEFANTAGQQAGTFQFDLPILPNNNLSGSFGVITGTATLDSNSSSTHATIYVNNGTKRVYFDGDRGNTLAAPLYANVSGQYTINN